MKKRAVYLLPEGSFSPICGKLSRMNRLKVETVGRP